MGTRLAVGDRLAVAPSLAYVQKGTEFDDGTKGSYDYIQIPVLLSLTVPVGATTSLEFGAGPQVGLQVECDEDGFDCTDYDNHQGTEFGLVGTAAVNLPITDRSTLSVGGSVDYGLSTLFENTTRGPTVCRSRGPRGSGNGGRLRRIAVLVSGTFL